MACHIPFHFRRKKLSKRERLKAYDRIADEAFDAFDEIVRREDREGRVDCDDLWHLSATVAHGLLFIKNGHTEKVDVYDSYKKWRDNLSPRLGVVQTRSRFSSDS